jgi:hypothetical protein
MFEVKFGGKGNKSSVLNTRLSVMRQFRQQLLDVEK